MTAAPDDPSAWNQCRQLVEALEAYQILGTQVDSPLPVAEWLTLPAETEIPLADIARLTIASRNSVLDQLADVRSELEELGALACRNRGVAAQLADRVATGKRQMQETLRNFEAARRIILKQGNRLLADLGAEQVDQALAPYRETIRTSHTTAGLTRAILEWQRRGVDLFDKAALQASQLQELTETVYGRFQETPTISPPPLSLERGRAELLDLGQRVEAFCHNALNLMATKASLLKKFDAGPATELHLVFAQGQRDAGIWLRGALSPLLEQIRESQAQLERRSRDEGKIREYLNTLEARMKGLEERRAELLRQQAGLERILSALQNP